MQPRAMKHGTICIATYRIVQFAVCNVTKPTACNDRVFKENITLITVYLVDMSEIRLQYSG